MKVFSRHRPEYQEESEGGQCGGPSTRAHLACGYSLRRAPVSLLCTFLPAGLHRQLGRPHPLGRGDRCRRGRGDKGDFKSMSKEEEGEETCAASRSTERPGVLSTTRKKQGERSMRSFTID